MGKYKKDKIAKIQRDNPMNSRNTLEDQIVASQFAESKKKEKVDTQDEEPEFVDEKTTKRILKEARKQQQKLEEEYGNKERLQKEKISKLSNKDDDLEESDDEDDFKLSDEAGEYEQEIVINPEDEKALELFMNKNAESSKTLANVIMEKFTEKQTELDSQFSEGGMNVQKLDPIVEKMYEGVRDVLARYRSGKVPKAFKLIPRLVNWEQVLQVTDPSGWSAAAMYQATRVFTSNLKENMAQRFFNLALLPRVRDDILQYKKLNFHLYQALRKALFKPGAFMKGILIPLCESGDCTLREAEIIGSVIGKNSVPILHSSAAMLKIAEMDYSGANSVFLRMLLDKKYALPYRVVDAIVHHFIRFEFDKRKLPVLWHQSLLVFANRYKEHISSEQKEALLNLLRAHTHHQITPEIRRELSSSKCRDEIMEEDKLLTSIQDISM